MKFVSPEGVRKVRVPVEEKHNSTFSEIVDQIKDPVSLTHNIINTQSQKRVRKFRSLRLSEIETACPRQWVIGHVRDIPSRQVIEFPRIAVMDMGSALHRWIQNSSVYFPDRLLGFWRCLSCGNRRRFGTKPDTPCEYCGASHRAAEYSEYQFRLPDTAPYSVVGKLDGIVQVGSKYRFIEIKTYGKPMERPDGAHIGQLASYMWFSKFDTSEGRLPIEIDRSVGYLLYFSKMMNFKAPIKTFPVRLTEALIAPYREKAALFTEGIRRGTLPVAYLKCVASQWGAPPAKLCPTGNECRKLQEAGVANILEEGSRVL